MVGLAVRDAKYFRNWLQGDIQRPEIDFCSTPESGHSEAHAGLPLLTQRRHSRSQIEQLVGWVGIRWNWQTA